MESLKTKLRNQLELADPGFIGCVRRNLLADETPKWSWISGNALSALVGEKHDIETPVGTFQAFLLKDRWLLQFRGGTWNDYWYDDFFLTWAVINEYSDLDLSRTIIVFHENRGQLTVRNVVVPDHYDPSAEVADALAQMESDPPGRLNKSRPRALRVCRYCPMLTRCNAIDQANGDTDDWHHEFPRG